MKFLLFTLFLFFHAPVSFASETKPIVAHQDVLSFDNKDGVEFELEDKVKIRSYFADGCDSGGWIFGNMLNISSYCRIDLPVDFIQTLALSKTSTLTAKEFDNTHSTKYVLRGGNFRVVRDAYASGNTADFKAVEEASNFAISIHCRIGVWNQVQSKDISRESVIYNLGKSISWSQSKPTDESASSDSDTSTNQTYPNPCFGQKFKSYSHVQTFTLNGDGSVTSHRDDGIENSYGGPYSDIQAFYDANGVCI